MYINHTTAWNKKNDVFVVPHLRSLSIVMIWIYYSQITYFSSRSILDKIYSRYKYNIIEGEGEGVGGDEKVNEGGEDQGIGGDKDGVRKINI